MIADQSLASFVGSFGRHFGDKGSISASLAERLLLDHGLRLIPRLRKNMRNVLMDLSDKLLLRNRPLIETIYDLLKNICQIEHSRHRSPYNFVVHLLAGLVAYCHQPKKPSLHLAAPRCPSPTLSRTDVTRVFGQIPSRVSAT